MTNKKQSDRLPQHIIDELLDKVSLKDVVSILRMTSESETMKRAICPFHSSKDNNKSLSLDYDSNKFYCDVCNFKGTAIGWLMYHDGLSFKESILNLSQIADVDVSNWIDEQSLIDARKSQASILNEVTSFYQRQTSNADIMDYIRSRDISDVTQSRFAIGYAPIDDDIFNDSFSSHARNLWNQGHLIRRSDGEFSPRFRNRLMFPIRNPAGDTVGFGARALGNALPKYLNSPTSPVFNKSKTLYGLYEMLSLGLPIDSLCLVEGYMDVITASQHGFTNTVATLGTAATAHHIEMIFEHTDTLVVCFDGDQAGQKAAMRLLEIALPHLSDEHRLSFAMLPAGDDPDTLLRRSGASAFNDELFKAEPIEVFLHNKLCANFDTTEIGGKAALASAAKPLINSMVSNRLKSIMIEKMEETVGIPWFYGW